MTRRGTNISLKSYEDIFTTEEKRQETGEQVVMIPVNQIHKFKNHPFNLILSKSREDERELYRQYLYQSLDIEILKERYPYGVEEIDEIFDIILDVLCSNQKFITISGDKKPINVVKSRFMKLDSSHIQFVMDSMKDKTTTNEDQNVGTEALNKTTATAENTARTLHQSRYSRKLQKDVKKGAEETTSTKAVQKNYMKKEFQRAAYKKSQKEAANQVGSISKKFVDKAEDLVGRFAEWIREKIMDNPLVIIIVLVILILILMLSGSAGLAGGMLGSFSDTTIATSYTADDDDIRAVEQDYKSTLSDSDVSKRIEKEKDKLKDISYKLNNLLDMHLEGKIDFETFEKKRDTLQNQLSEKKIEIEALEDIGNSKLDLEDRIAFMREKLETETTIKEFDRQVFESIVDYVIVGGYNEEGNADPSMITFVYRTGFKDRKDANHFKPERLNAAKKKTGSDSYSKEVCQSDDTSSNSSLSHSGLQSLIPDDSNILQSNTSPDACGDGMSFVQTPRSEASCECKT
ncbi:MAG: DUF6017 domain-containing protein [Lachnospiraceae bacterium]|nr:DUF6017 domain-containing protein [Lachnospiraceae bacterium]